MNIEELHKSHLCKEPEKYKKDFLKLGMKLKTGNYIEWEIKKANIESVMAIDKNKRQKMLEKFSKGGITIKEVATLFNESCDAMSQLIYYNLEERTILRSETI